MKREEKAYRDRSVDVMKGLLVVQMVLCHCVQFFGNESRTVQKEICEYINLTTFSGFLFAFGLSCYYAYFSRSLRDSWRRMVRTAVKCLLAFYLSSLCYIAFVEYDYYDPRVIKQVLLLQKYAGWSEFLASFFGIMVVGLAGFPLFRRMNGYLVALLGELGFLVTHLPYDQIQHPLLALFTGSGSYVTFPVFSYLFYFAAGVWFCKRRAEGKNKGEWLVAAAAVLLSVPEAVYYAQNGALSGRFPPDWQFIFGGAGFVYLYDRISRINIPVTAAEVFRKGLAEIGGNAIFYLLFTNIMIFSLSASKFKLRNLSFAVKIYVVLMLSAWFCQHLVRPKTSLARRDTSGAREK